MSHDMYQPTNLSSNSWEEEASTISENPKPQGHYLNTCSHGILRGTWQSWVGTRSQPDELPNTKTKPSSPMKVTHTGQAAWTLGYNVDKALASSFPEHRVSACQPSTPRRELGTLGERGGAVCRMLGSFLFLWPAVGRVGQIKIEMGLEEATVWILLHEVEDLLLGLIKAGDRRF